MTEAIQRLLRFFFKDTLDPLDDTTEIDVSKKHIQELAEIILYTSNPIYHHELRDKTYTTARQILPFTRLRNMLPATVMEIVIGRFNKNLGNNVIRAAQDIVLVAERNQLFWSKKATLQCGIEYSTGSYGNSICEPKGIEGWVPVTIHRQKIWVRVGSFDMYPGNIRDCGDNLFITIDGHNNHLGRCIPRQVLLDQPTDDEVADLSQNTWALINLCHQRTWIRYDPSVFELLPKSNNLTKYMTLTLHAFFPSTRVLSAFVHSDSWVNLFQTWPQSGIPRYDSRGVAQVQMRGVPDFVRDDEDDYENPPVETATPDPTPVPSTQIVVTGIADSQLKVVLPFLKGREYDGEGYDQGVPRYDYIVWSKPATDVRFCEIRSFINMINVDFIEQRCMFHRIVDEISCDAITNDDVYIQYSWRDYLHRTVFYKVQFLNLTKLLDIYQYFHTREPNYEGFFSDLSGYSLDDSGPRVVSRMIVRKTQPVEQPKLTLPKRIRDLCVAEFAQKEEMCPIAMEPMTAENMAITTCFHFFQKEAIETWLSKNNQCPQCRMPTSLML